jgi:hypothetical protein
VEVRLEADADASPLRARPAEEIERRVHVARLLHVDPDEGAERRRARRERTDVRRTRLAIDVEPEVRELDRDLRRQSARAQPLEDVEVAVANGGALGAGRDLLAELREQRADPLAPEPRRGVEGRAGVLARQEPPRRAPEEGAPGQLARENSLRAPGRTAAAADARRRRRRAAARTQPAR